MPPVSKPNWEAEGIRFSAFPPVAVSFEAKPTWEKLVGSAPQEIQERPQQGLRNEFGPFLGQHLFVTQQATRIDIIAGVHPDTAAAATGHFGIGSFERAQNAHVQIVKKWFDMAPSLGRLALAPTVFHPVRSIQEGYEFFKQVLPKLPLDRDTRNFLWQVNRPRKSKVVPELTINRLSRWHMLSQQKMQISTEAGGNIRSAVEDFLHSAKVEIDLFTDPFIPLPSESLPALLDELAEAASEILKLGDIP